jgi:hypothetical protein
MTSLRDEYNGFWIGWMHLLTLILQLQSITRVHDQWLSKTRSIPYWTMSVFSSAVTDLVLIYESVTSSTATALNDDCRTNELFWVWGLCYDRRSAGQSVLEQSTHLGLTTRSWLLSDSPLYSLARIHGNYCLLVRIRGNLCWIFVDTKRAYRTVAQQWIILCLFVAGGTSVWRAVD